MMTAAAICALMSVSVLAGAQDNKVSRAKILKKARHRTPAPPPATEAAAPAEKDVILARPNIPVPPKEPASVNAPARPVPPPTPAK